MSRAMRDCPSRWLANASSASSLARKRGSLGAADFLMTQLNMAHGHAVREGSSQQVRAVFYISLFYVETV